MKHFILLITFLTLCHNSLSQGCQEYQNMMPTSGFLQSQPLTSPQACCDFATANGLGIQSYTFLYHNSTDNYQCHFYDGTTIDLFPGNTTYIVLPPTTQPTTLPSTTPFTGSTTPSATAPTTLVTTISAGTNTISAGTGSTTVQYLCPPPISDQPEEHPHPDDCRKYIVCYEGNYAVRDCGAGFLFDYIASQCRPAPEAQCAPGSTTPTAPPAPTTTTRPPPHYCPPTGSTRMPHLYDCRKYYYCVDGAGYEATCWDESLFDSRSSYCVQWDLAYCFPSATTPLPLTCRPDGSTYYLPHPSDCRRYIACIEGQIEDRLCPNGRLFDFYDEMCKLPPEAICAPGATTPSPIASSTPVPIQCPPEGIFSTPHPYDCRKYYICIRGNGYLETCGLGQLFDRNLLDCVPENSAVCHPGATTEPPSTTTTELTTELATTTTTTITPIPTTLQPTTEMATTILPTTSPPFVISCPPFDWVFVPHPTDCSRYFECQNGTPIERRCRYNEIFDFISSSCMSKQSIAQCYPGATTTEFSFSSSTLPAAERLIFGSLVIINILYCLL